MMCITALLRYSIFRFSAISVRCNFADWLDVLAVDPQPFLRSVLANTPAIQG